MIARDEIRNLPITEKLALLEEVWSEIAAEPERLEIPQWHNELLDQRDKAYKAGTVRAISWEDAKLRIQQAIW